MENALTFSIMRHFHDSPEIQMETFLLCVASWLIQVTSVRRGVSLAQQLSVINFSIVR